MSFRTKNRRFLLKATAVGSTAIFASTIAACDSSSVQGSIAEPPDAHAACSADYPCGLVSSDAGPDAGPVGFLFDGGIDGGDDGGEDAGSDAAADAATDSPTNDQ
jgi:hypothetical protein